VRRRREPVNLSFGHRADLTEILGDEQVGGQPAERGGVHADDGLAGTVEPQDFGIYGDSGGVGIDRGGRDPGQAEHRCGMIALVGDPDQAAGATQCRHDLGGGGQ
jgi:hypothetical protein